MNLTEAVKLFRLENIKDPQYLANTLVLGFPHEDYFDDPFMESRDASDITDIKLKDEPYGQGLSIFDKSTGKEYRFVPFEDDPYLINMEKFKADAEKLLQKGLGAFWKFIKMHSVEYLHGDPRAGAQSPLKKGSVSEAEKLDNPDYYSKVIVKTDELVTSSVASNGSLDLLPVLGKPKYKGKVELGKLYVKYFSVDGDVAPCAYSFYKEVYDEKFDLSRWSLKSVLGFVSGREIFIVPLCTDKGVVWTLACEQGSDNEIVLNHYYNVIKTNYDDSIVVFDAANDF